MLSLGSRKFRHILVLVTLFFAVEPTIAEPTAVCYTPKAGFRAREAESLIDRIAAYVLFLDRDIERTDEITEADLHVSLERPSIDGRVGSTFVCVARRPGGQPLAEFVTTGVDGDSLVREIGRRITLVAATIDAIGVRETPAATTVRILDSLALTDLPGIGETVDARTIELAIQGGILVAGTDDRGTGFFLELGDAFELRRRIHHEGGAIAAIAADVDGRIAYLDARSQRLFTVFPGTDRPMETLLPEGWRDAIEYLDDGSIALVNLSTRRADRLLGSILVPVALFPDADTLVDAIDRGPGGEIWAVDRRRGRVLIVASDGTIVDSIDLPSQIVGAPVRAISVGRDGSCVLLTADRILYLDRLGRTENLVDAIEIDGPVPIAQITDIAYRAETGELFLLDPSAERVHRLLLQEVRGESVAAQLAYIKDTISHTTSHAEIRRLRTRVIAVYERHGAMEMAGRIREELVYDDPFTPIEIPTAPRRTRVGSDAPTSVITSASPIPSGFTALAAQIGTAADRYGIEAYDTVPRAVAAWEMLGLFAPENTDDLGPTVRARASAVVIRNGRARRAELVALTLDFWRAAGLEVSAVDGPNGVLPAFRSAVPTTERDRLGTIARSAVEIDGELWIVLSPETIGRPFLYAAASTGQMLEGVGAPTSSVVHTVGGSHHIAAFETTQGDSTVPDSTSTTAMDVPTITPLPMRRYEERVGLSLERIENTVRQPILAAARSEVADSAGRARLAALNELALAEICAGVPNAGSIGHAAGIWQEILELDPDNAAATTNRALLEELRDGHVELFALPWIRSR